MQHSLPGRYPSNRPIKNKMADGQCHLSIICPCSDRGCSAQYYIFAFRSKAVHSTFATSNMGLQLIRTLQYVRNKTYSWPEMMDSINILIRCEFAYHVEFGFICEYSIVLRDVVNRKCVSKVGHLQLALALVVGSETKSTDVFDALFD